MPEPRFEQFIFDDDNENKFLEHGLTPQQVASMLYEFEFQVRRNRRARSGLYLLIGRDESGQCIATPVEPYGQPGSWRPITAWRCKPSEQAQLG